MCAQATVVFTDLDGSTAVFGTLGNAAATELITTITSWIVGVSASCDGRVVKTLGDGVMLVFMNNDRALEFVVAIQRGHTKGRQSVRSDTHLPIRIGVASGEVEVVAEDCYGDAVNVASRLCDLCGPNQIWVSDSVVKSIGLPVGIGVRPLGDIHIRGRSAACSVYQIEWREEEPSDFLTMQAQIAVEAGFGRDALGKEVHLICGNSHAMFRSYDLPVHIGRVKTAEFVVSNPRVSRTHAKLEWRNGGVILTDLSTYGTWVRFENDSPGDLLLRRDECVLHGSGLIALGAAFTDASVPCVHFEVR